MFFMALPFMKKKQRDLRVSTASHKTLDFTFFCYRILLDAYSQGIFLAEHRRGSLKKTFHKRWATLVNAKKKCVCVSHSNAIFITFSHHFARKHWIEIKKKFKFFSWLNSFGSMCLLNFQSNRFKNNNEMEYAPL